jgi:pimeloyl-ACP methyl ester carboxylesterase
MSRASAERRRGAGSRIGRPLKIILGLLFVLLVLVILNAFALNNETKSAHLNVPGAELVQTTSGPLQVLDTGSSPSQPTGSLPIVLIHGSAGAINWWDELIPRLKPDHRVIAIDLLGYGGSEKPDSDYSIETQAGLVAQVLAKLRVTQAVLVGHSLGGNVVTSVAEQAPDLVAGLVLIDSGPDNSGGLSGSASAARTPLLGQALWRIAPDSVIRENVSQGFAPGYDVPDKYVEDVREMTYPAYSKSAEEGEAFKDDRTLPDRLTTVAKPLLVIFGEEDQIYDAREALSAYAAVPGARTHLILGSGHSPQVEAPDQTAKSIIGFARGIAAAQAADDAAAAKARVKAAKEKARAARQAANSKVQQARKRAKKARNKANRDKSTRSPNKTSGAQSGGTQNSGGQSGNGAVAKSRTESPENWKPTRSGAGTGN